MLDRTTAQDASIAKLPEEDYEVARRDDQSFPVPAPLIPGTNRRPPRNLHKKLSRTEVSRLNGAKSQGPITEAGMHKPSADSYRNGILARKLRPVADGKQEHVEYDHLRRALEKQFGALGPMAECQIAALAADWVTLGRIMRLREAIMVHGGFESDYYSTESAADVSELLALLEDLTHRIEDGRPLEYSREQSQSLADLIVYYADQFKEDSQWLDEQSLPADQRQFKTITDSKQMEALTKSVKEIRQMRLGSLGIDKTRLRDWLSGKGKPNRADKPRWIRFLSFVKPCLHGRLEFAEECQYDRNRADTNSWFVLFNRMDNLLLLQRYETTIRRNIERVTRSLQELADRATADTPSTD